MGSLLPLLACVATVAGDYYIDSHGGSDSNGGTAEGQPWRTLARLNSAPPLTPGEQLRLAKGGVWRERLTIAGGGNDTHGPVVYTSYGNRSDKKPLLLGSVAVGGSGNWTPVPGASGQWQTFPKQLIPAAGATELLHNSDFAAGSSFWSLWNENPEGFAHVSGGVYSGTTVVPPSASGVTKSYQLTFKDMTAAPQSYTQLFTTNVSVASGLSYRLSFWAKSSADLNVSDISVFAMKPPYMSCAPNSEPVLLKGSSGSDGGWNKYSVDFLATDTCNQQLGNQARVTWWFRADESTGGVPNNAQVWIAGATFKHVVEADPDRVTFEETRDVGNLLLFVTRAFGLHSEPDHYGWKMWAQSDVKKNGDFHFDRYSKLLTTFCDKGPPSKCWPGGVEAALDITQVNMDGASHVVVDSLAVWFGAAHGVNGGSVDSIVVRNCDFAWIGGGVLSYDFRSTGKPVRYGNGIQWWNGARNVEVYNNKLWQIYDTPLTNQGESCVASGESQQACAMRNISYHHNLATNSGMACVEIWYSDPNATMDEVRFENNLCANIGNGGWSAGQRADPAGRSVCFYHNSAKTTAVSIRNNLIYQTVGFEAMVYVSDRWTLWAEQALQFDHNALFRTSVTPPPPPSHNGSLDEMTDYVKLIGASPMHIHSTADFAQFSKSHGGSGKATIFADPKLRGVAATAGSDVDMQKLTHSGLETGSPLKNTGVAVRWLVDFNGKAIPTSSPSIGPFQ